MCKCPVFEDLARLLRKTIGLVDVLREALLPVTEQIESAFVYGSMASGEAHANSDVDVMIIGQLDFTDAVLALAPAQDTLQREVNASVFTAEEFAEKRRSREGFVAQVWRGPKVWVIGHEKSLKS